MSQIFIVLYITTLYIQYNTGVLPSEYFIMHIRCEQYSKNIRDHDLYIDLTIISIQTQTTRTKLKEEKKNGNNN